MRSGLANSPAPPVWIVPIALFLFWGVLVSVCIGGDYFTVDVVTSIAVRAVALGLVAAG